MNAKLDAIRAEEERQQQEAAQRRAAAEQAYDREFVASYSTRQVEADLNAAHVRFMDDLAASPLVRAMTEYMHAMQSARTLAYERANALMQLSEPSPPPHDFPRAELTGAFLLDFMEQAMRRAVMERVDAEVAQRAAARDAAGQAAAEGKRER